MLNLFWETYKYIFSIISQHCDFVSLLLMLWRYNEPGHQDSCGIDLRFYKQFNSLWPSDFNMHLDHCPCTQYKDSGLDALKLRPDYWHVHIHFRLTLNVRGGPSYLSLTRSISWLLMPWLLTSPGHQQPWYWLYRICRSCSYLRKNFKYLCQINVEEWHKM